jgi:hypothetical protein
MKLAYLLRRASALDMSDLHDLHSWVQLRIAQSEKSRVILDVAADSRILAEQKVGRGYFRLEAPRCKRKSCAHCKSGGAHTPRWFVYFYDRGALRSAYIGEFDIAPVDMSSMRLATSVEIMSGAS